MIDFLKTSYKPRDDLKEFVNSLPSSVTLVAASKYVRAEDIRKMYDCGIHDFGENRVDSFLLKQNQLSNLQIKWHFIGHLQRNKAAKVINFIDCLHSLDSLKLADCIEKYRTKPLDCFIEVSINQEENKDGVNPEELEGFVKAILEHSKIKLVGFMMMAKADSSHEELINQFTKLKTLRDEIEDKLQIKIPYLSMGMSDDYLEAIECGATHVRLGRILYSIDNKC